MLIPVLLLSLGAYAQQVESSSNSSITSSNLSITWIPCSDAAQVECASYQVPLDYANSEIGNATLAVARFKATKQPRLGSIFINPGGPGGSGVSLILSAGEILSSVINGQYDVVSWDPRGVNRTKPQITCGFSSQEDLDQFWNGTIPGVGVEARGNFTDQEDLDSFFTKVNETDAKIAQFGQKCLETDGAFLKYMGTTAVVRDMVSLSDALEGPGKPVNYYGISYGTVIGNYFVNMFPERVGRVIIDGVVDSIVWATEPSYKIFSTSFRSAESTFAGFTQTCVQAGPDACALAQDNATSVSIGRDVRELIDTAYDLHKAGDFDPTHTSFEVRRQVYGALGSPTSWGELASQLANLTSASENKTTGNATTMALHSRAATPRQNVNTSDTNTPAFMAGVTITCVDSIDQGNVSTKQVFDELVRVTHEESSTFGEVASAFSAFYCHGFPARAVERFTGPFNHALAHPIIVIGNKADPVTPFSNAQKIADTLGSSAHLLEQDGFGHTSIQEHSNCTLGMISDYFLHGKLPAKGKVCNIDQVIFPTNSNNTSTLVMR